MTTYPSLIKLPSTLGSPPSVQNIQTSIRGVQFGLSAGSSLIGGQLVIGPQGYPLAQQGGTVPTATTADTIGNFGDYVLTSTAVSAVFTVDNPVPGTRLRLGLNANPSTAIKFVTPSSNVSFSSTANSNSLTIGSSLFFSAHALELRGDSTAAYRVMSWYSQTGSTILPSYTT